MPRHMVLNRIILIGALLGLASCSGTDFSAGSSPQPGGNKNNQQSKIETVTQTKPVDVLFISVLSGPIVSEGRAGACNQAFLNAGRTLQEQKILPAIKKNISQKIILGISNQNSDILLSAAGQICPASESSWSQQRNKMVCQRASSGLGPFSVEQGVGSARVCGNLVGEQSPFAYETSPFRSSDISNTSRARHVVIATINKGSSLTSDMFIAAVKKNLGADTKVSIIYPKNPLNCESASIIPAADDTSWLSLPESAKGPSTMFEEIASKTGGTTYDLCNPSELDEIGRRP